MSKRVYISASTQKENIGVATYGNERDRMFELSSRVKYWLDTQNKSFEVFRNHPNWSLEQTVDHCNDLKCDIFIDNHSNAGPKNVAGTEVYYNKGSVMGPKLAKKMFDRIWILSPGLDRGVLSDSILYRNGLYVLRETHPPAALIEHIYHTNLIDVQHFVSNINMYAKAEAMAICDYFDIPWIEPISEVDELVNGLFQFGFITDKPYWTAVLNGSTKPNLEYLKTLLKRTIKK